MLIQHIPSKILLFPEPFRPTANVGVETSGLQGDWLLLLYRTNHIDVFIEFEGHAATIGFKSRNFYAFDKHSPIVKRSET